MGRVVGCKLPSLLSETLLAGYGELIFASRVREPR